MDEIISTIRLTLISLMPRAVSPFVSSAVMEILNDFIEKGLKLGEGGIATYTLLRFASINRLGLGKITPILDDLFDKYDLHDVLDYIYDSSHPFWRTYSTTRASSLLRRTLPLAIVLKLFTSGKLDDLGVTVRRVCDFDANTGQWLLDQIPSIVGEELMGQGGISKLYSSVILSELPDIVKTTAISNLASILENSLDVHRSSVQITDLPSNALMKQFGPGTAAQTWNRDMTNSLLRLHGCLLTIAAVMNEWEFFLNELGRELRLWTIKLQYAIQEETVS